MENDVRMYICKDILESIGPFNYGIELVCVQ